MRSLRDENDAAVNAALADKMAVFASLAAAHVLVFAANVTDPSCHDPSSITGIRFFPALARHSCSNICSGLGASPVDSPQVVPPQFGTSYFLSGSRTVLKQQ